MSKGRIKGVGGTRPERGYCKVMLTPGDLYWFVSRQPRKSNTRANPPDKKKLGDEEKSSTCKEKGETTRAWRGKISIKKTG